MSSCRSSKVRDSDGTRLDKRRGGSTPRIDAATSSRLRMMSFRDLVSGEARFDSQSDDALGQLSSLSKSAMVLRSSWNR